MGEGRIPFGAQIGGKAPNRMLKKSVLDFFSHVLSGVNGRTPFCRNLSFI